MPKKLPVIFFLIVSYLQIPAQNDSLGRVTSPHVSPTLRFTENKGQWDENILFRAQLDGGALFLEKNCITFNFYDKKKYRSFHHGGVTVDKYSDAEIKGHAYKMHFVNASDNATVEKLQAGTDYENFFLGNDKSKWQGHVNNYHQVWLHNLYNGIDYEAITAANGLKYNFHLKAGADPLLIQLRYEGVEKIALKAGALVISLDVNKVIEQRPYAYQMIDGHVKPVNCRYLFKDNTLGFEFPKGYNKRYDLVIDPVLVFAAQSGSTADNFGMTATYDPQGNLYSGGTVFDVGYPTTTGAYSSNFFGPVYYGNSDVVVTKYNATGNQLLFSTYIGGGNTETVNSMIVDQNNNLCFFGVTSSNNFPASAGAYDNSYNGGSFIMFVNNGQRFVNGTDLYVAKFNSTGTTLMACTYLGGSANDGLNHSNAYNTYINIPATPPATGTISAPEPRYDSLQKNYGDQCRGEIQLDLYNNIYITSSTRSANFPAVNAFDNSLGGKQDGFLAKFNPSLSALLYCSFIGGSSNDAGYGLIVKNNFEVYVTGGTCSADFPYTTGGYQASYQGGKADGFVLRVSPSGTVVTGGTFFGTSSFDQSYFIQSDKYGDIYLYGQSTGAIPTMTASNETTLFTVPNTHQFISRLNKDLNALTMSTTFGNLTNATDISPAAFSVDKCGNIYISGWGGPVIAPFVPLLDNMPLLSATQSTTDGHDFYFMGLDSNASVIIYGSYFGGASSEEHVDGGTSRFDPLGKIYQSVCAGCGGNDDFPVTPGAWPLTPGNPNHGSNCNNGVVKLDFQLLITVSTINTNTVAGCVPLTINFTGPTTPTTPGSSFTWYLEGGVTNNTNVNPSYTYTAPGIYTVSLVARNPAACNDKDSTITYITVYPTPTVNFSYSVTPCMGVLTTSNLSTGNFGPYPFTWDFGNSVTSTLTAPSYTYSNSGNYNLSLTATDIHGCSTTLTKPIVTFNFTTSVTNATICQGSSVPLPASGGTSYTWTPPSGLSNTASSSPVANPSISTIYTIQIENNSSGFPCNTTRTIQVLVNPTPTANFNFTVNPCGGGVYFNDLSQNNIVAWNWSLGPGLTSTLQAPYHFYFLGANTPVRLIVTNSFGCKDSLKKPLTAPAPPPLSISPDTMVCLGSSLYLSAGGGTSYAWTPADSTMKFPVISNPKVTPYGNTEYSVVITTTNTANGEPCRFLLTTQVNVSYPSAIPVSAQADPTLIVTGNQSTLTYIGDPGAIVYWYPLGSTVPTNGYTVTAKPDKPTTYTAVATYSVCREKAVVLVDAFTEGCIEKDVFIPNTFTPNNDGQNDLFMVRGIKINEMHFAVYNRWGEMVFETTDKTRGWDGTYKGRPADIGVFGWYLKVKCFNGEETFRKGNVTLIR